MAPVFMGQMPSCHLTNSVKELKEIKALIPTRENHPPAHHFLTQCQTPNERGVVPYIRHLSDGSI